MSNRRRFLRDLGWGAMAAGLAGVSAFLLSRRNRSGAIAHPAVDRRAHTCSNHWICSSCSRLADCSLPQALSARAHGLKQGGGSGSGTKPKGSDGG
jgi:hypothetical protein